MTIGGSKSNDIKNLFNTLPLNEARENVVKPSIHKAVFGFSVIFSSFLSLRQMMINQPHLGI
jgi:hypothetical protein